MKVQTGQGTIPLITLVGIFSISATQCIAGTGGVAHFGRFE